MDAGTEHESASVNKQVASLAREVLCSVVAVLRPSRPGALDRLSVADM